MIFTDNFVANTKPTRTVAIFFAAAISVFAAEPSHIVFMTRAGIYGELMKLHRVSLAFEGPQSSEGATPNPFLDYRLDVTFSHPESGKTLVVPGYYAADGSAGETSAKSGNIWRVHKKFTWFSSF